MKILCDENIPSPLIEDFVGHECRHVIEIGWAGISNGRLLSKAEEAGFDVLLTFDGKIPKQNPPIGRSIGWGPLKLKLSRDLRGRGHAVSDLRLRDEHQRARLAADEPAHGRNVVEDAVLVV